MDDMGFRDRFFTPKTARAILSWRILLGAGIAVAIGFAGVPWLLAAGVGVLVYVGSVAASMPKGVARPTIDPFMLSEPWRQIIQRAQGSGRKLRETIGAVGDGPLKERLSDIAREVDRGIGEAWEVARGGDAVDDAVRRLDPTALRSRLTTLRQQAVAHPSAEADAAVESVDRQLQSADRLKAKSEETATNLRLTQARLDELVARAAEVRIGAIEADSYAKDVADLVIDLEALHLAIEDTADSDRPSPGSETGTS